MRPSALNGDIGRSNGELDFYSGDNNIHASLTREQQILLQSSSGRRIVSFEEEQQADFSVRSARASGDLLVSAQNRLDQHSSVHKLKEGQVEVYRREILLTKKALAAAEAARARDGGRSATPSSSRPPSRALGSEMGELARRLQAADAAAAALVGNTAQVGSELAAAEKDARLLALQKALTAAEQARASDAKREEELLDSMEEIAARHDELKESNRRLREEAAEGKAGREQPDGELLAMRRAAWARERELLDLLDAILKGKVSLKDALQVELMQPQFTAVDQIGPGAITAALRRAPSDTSSRASSAQLGLLSTAVAALAIVLAVCGTALVSALLRAERISDELAAAKQEVSAARDFRLVDRAAAMVTLNSRLMEEAAAAAAAAARGQPLRGSLARKLVECDDTGGDLEGECSSISFKDGARILNTAGHFSDSLCRILCPGLDGADAGGHYGGHGGALLHEADAGDGLGIRMRLVAAVVAVGMVVGPMVFMSNAKKMRDSSGQPMNKVLSYRLDVWFSENANSKPLALLCITGMLVVFGTLALLASSGGNLYNETWTAVAGVGVDWTFAGEEERSAAERLVAVVISVGGMLVTALMLGIVSDAIGEKMDDLRKGKSEVLESGHTLILGWNDKVLPIIKQLSLANESAGGGTVVILADRDKEEMDVEVRHFYETELAIGGDEAGGAATAPKAVTHVICRKGSAILMNDLNKVSVATAKSIIVLSEQADVGTSDARALRIVLSLVGLREQAKRRGAATAAGAAAAAGATLHHHIVVEVADLSNEPLVRLLGGDIVETVVSEDVIGRLMLQCARQPGLALVFDVLLGFQDNEFYIKAWPDLIGRRFGDIMRMFADAVPVGVHSPRSDGGQLQLNPDDDYVLEEGDELVVVAEDEDTYEPLTGPVYVTPATPPRRDTKPVSEKVLFCGWRHDMPELVLHLDNQVRDGSELWLFNNMPLEERDACFERAELDIARDLTRLVVKHVVGDTASRKDLQGLPLEKFSSALILADASSQSDADSVATQDSRTLATLLLVRDIQTTRVAAAAKAPSTRRTGNWIGEMRRQAGRRCEMVCEILDVRTRGLFEDTQCCDYVQSNELISKTLAMVSEDRLVNLVLKELFSSKGNELYIRKASDYVFPGEELSFFELQSRCRTRREVLVGVRLGPVGVGGIDGAAPVLPVLNPPDKGVRRRWVARDELVVFAQRNRS